MGLLDRLRPGMVPDEVPRPAAGASLPLAARSVLVACHGSAGAMRAAEAVVSGLAPGARLHQLVVVPELWRHMSGDGWRINASTEGLFCDYLEGQIERETLEVLERVHALAAARSIAYSAASCCGDPARSVIAAANAGDYDLVVVGAPRPRGVRGLRSRMDVETLMRGLRVPLVVVPHPQTPSAKRDGR
ncbi:MAG: universal stress protein [Pseudomonadota bacterium]